MHRPPSSEALPLRTRARPRAGPPPKKKRWRSRRDWGGALAKLLCLVFAGIGVVPLALGGLVRLDSVQQWVAERTATLLSTELGVEAQYELELNPWPLEIAI